MALLSSSLTMHLLECSMFACPQREIYVDRLVGSAGKQLPLPEMLERFLLLRQLHSNRNHLHSSFWRMRKMKRNQFVLRHYQRPWKKMWTTWDKRTDTKAVSMVRAVSVRMTVAIVFAADVMRRSLLLW